MSQSQYKQITTEQARQYIKVILESLQEKGLDDNCIIYIITNCLHSIFISNNISQKDFDFHMDLMKRDYRDNLESNVYKKYKENGDKNG